MTELTPRERAQRKFDQIGKPQLDLTVEGQHVGVSVAWLSQVFRHDTKTIKRLLADCPFELRNERKTGTARNSQRVYQLRDAAAYLVEPKVDIDGYMQNMKAEQLPPKLQAAFWDAKMKKTKWMQDNGLLYHKQDVLHMFGQVFQTVKFTLQLWPGTLDQNTELDENQYQGLETMCNQLMQDVADKIMELAEGETALPLAAQEADEDVPDDITDDI